MATLENDSVLPPPPPLISKNIQQNHEDQTPPSKISKRKVKVKTIVNDGCENNEDDWKKEVCCKCFSKHL